MKCRICNERNSSLWLAEKTKFSIDKIESDDWIKQPKNWDQLIELLPHCVNIDFFGGEPLLNKPILALFEMAKKMHVAKNIRLNINTNGSIWNQNFADFFPAFRSVNIGISIDDIKQRFELQRGSCWPTVEQNVKKFISLNNHRFHAYIYTTINIQNVYYLPELLEWANEIGADIMFSNLNYPEYLDVDRMTEAAKSLVSERLSRSSDVRLRDIAARINRSMGSDGQEFVKFMLDLDQKRQQDFGLAHREIATAMGYTV
jgi:MoaA/NifB/PqqE/SkfB family radical SAM enzyme